MKSRILVILPTRNRGKKTRECLEAWSSCSNEADLLLCVDDDDVDLPIYEQLSKEFGTKLRVGPRLRMCPTLNQASLEEADNYEYLAFIGDDHRFRTKGWDEIAVNTLERQTNGWGIWYGNDLLKGKDLPTAAVMGSKLVKKIGGMSLPGLIHLYLDDFWKMLGEELGVLYYDDDVIIEHMHFTVGKGDHDQMYAEVNSPTMFNSDARVFHDWRLNKLPAQKQEILICMENDNDA